jgi:hypothetical protein
LRSREHFIEASRTKLQDMMERKLDKVRLCALLIDATPFEGQQCSDRLICMRGQDKRQSDMFSHLSPEQRVRPDHLLRAIRAMADLARWNMSSRFDEMYSQTGPTVDPAREVAARSVAADVVFDSQ